MSLIQEIQEKLKADAFEFSKHAVDQSIIRRISVRELREAIAVGEVIEEYPDDKYGPSCLIYGRTRDGRAIHVQCNHPSRSMVKVITLYEPDPDRWADYKTRRL